jgi:deoxycytidine triphosphate deaminase
MLLGKSEIDREKLLNFTKEQYFRDASYDLTIDTIFDLNTYNKKDRFVLEPGGMVLAFSTEVFNLPSDILGITTVKNSLSNDGIMAVNIGLVDPKYIGPISCILINFGKANKIIIKEDTFLRMSFQRIPNVERTQIEKSDEELYQIKESYINDKILASSKKLGNTFLSLNSFSKNILEKTKVTIFKEILKQIGYIAFLVTIITWGISQYKGSEKIDEIKLLQKEIKNLTKELKNLKEGNEKK